MIASDSIGLGTASSIWRNKAAWLKAADIAVVLLAISLPWSTTFVAIFAVTWLLLLVPLNDVRNFIGSMKRPPCAIPLLLFALAVVGMLWAVDTPWAVRLKGIGPVAKLLAIPVLIYQFERSGRGLSVALGFLASCTVIMLMSWLSFVEPRLSFDPTRAIGIPVKNYISQSQEFALCAFGAFGAAVYVSRANQKTLGIFLAILGVSFLANMVFVASSRTVLVCIPVLFVIFGIIHFKRGGVLILMAAVVAAGAIGWMSSPYLRWRTSEAVREYHDYHEKNAVTSTGQRLEFWRKSIRFIADAPVAGHGTGSTRGLFDKDAVGKTGVSAEVIGNPHNQTLNVAVQWGLIGVVVLYAMWLMHLKLFAGTASLAGWIGLVAVVENVVSSLFNSHLFDFTEGWVYVLAVGVAGGMVNLRMPSTTDPGQT